MWYGRNIFCVFQDFVTNASEFLQNLENVILVLILVDDYENVVVLTIDVCKGHILHFANCFIVL